jgi:hypothetical protein
MQKKRLHFSLAHGTRTAIRPMAEEDFMTSPFVQISWRPKTLGLFKYSAEYQKLMHLFRSGT